MFTAPVALDEALILEATYAVRGEVRRTPMEASRALAAAVGAPVLLKLEHLQTTGSFKARGALFRVQRLTARERALGVTTASAGNHGKGLAWAAGRLGVDAEIHVPSTIDAAKHRGILALGARVVVSEHGGYDDTEAEARAAAARDGRVWVSAFDDPAVMAGNGGTLAAEVLEDVPDVATVVFPVGGGGLGAGLSLWLRARRPTVRLVATQLKASPALALSLARGEAVVRLPAVDTLAGGVEGGIGVGTFAVLRQRIDDIVLVTEAEVRAATRWMLAEHQYLVEPTAAVPVAALLSGRLSDVEGPVVVVLTGRNVAWETVRDLLNKVE